MSDRFNRSVRLEKDFLDPSSLEAYVVTEEASEQVNRILKGLTNGSGQRAWRITGDYGSGKSSFALLLAHLFLGRDQKIPRSVWSKLEKRKITSYDRGYLTILVTGSRAPLRQELLRSLMEALSEPLFFGEHVDTVPELAINLYNEANKLRMADLSDRKLLDFIQEVNSSLIKAGLFKGILIVLDELGKFLEYAADNPQEQDVFFLQELAEYASRSRSKPLFVVGILHRGLASYAKSAGPQKELEKVSGRYEEVVFKNSISHLAVLTAEALGEGKEKLSANFIKQLDSSMGNTLKEGVFGSSASSSFFKDLSSRLYPLHPTVLPLLSSFFSKFGQNERSLFGFFVSQEPEALQNFADQHAEPQLLYRAYNFYDYATSNFGHLLSEGSYSSNWNHIESIIRTFRSDNELEEKVLKTVGILGFLALKEVRATKQIISLCLDEFDEKAIEATIAKLSSKGVLFSRGSIEEYRLWDHSSVDLEQAYQRANELYQSEGGLFKKLKDYGLLSERPLVARRHFIETGNLRHFEVQYIDVKDLEKEIFVTEADSDGRLIIPVCETKQQLSLAKEMLIDKGSECAPQNIVGICSHPLMEIEQLVRNCFAWQYVYENEGGLKDDRFAAEEASRALQSARRELGKSFQASLGLGAINTLSERTISWYRIGDEEAVGSGRDLNRYLSEVCDQVYPSAPLIVNELINRRKISSAARSACNRLIECLFDKAEQKDLGFSEDKAPPEKSMYLSTVHAGLVHVERSSGYKVIIPTSGKSTDPCNLSPAFTKMLDILESNPDQRISVDFLFNELKKPPFGIRDGLMPLLLAILIICRRNQIALYYEGTFANEIDTHLFQVLAKKPNIFELQSCKIDGLRIDLLEQIHGVLKQGTGQPTQLLDVIQPLCQAIAGLSEYVRKTDHLSTIAKKVRDSILNAADPGKLLFKDLPEALGLEAFQNEKQKKLTRKAIVEFSNKLEKALDELRHALNALRARLQLSILRAFEKKENLEEFQDARSFLTTQSEEIAIVTSNMDLKAFCMRMMDKTKSDSEWIDSVASFLANSPPDKWLNKHEEIFEDRLHELAGRFARAQQLVFENSKSTDADGFRPVRISLSKIDGSEKGRVLQLKDSDMEKARKIAQDFKKNLPKDNSIALAALYDLFWDILPEDE